MSSVRDLLHKIDTTNSISRKAGRKRPRTVSTGQNIEHAAELIYNTNTNKIYIAPGILKRIGAQTHGVTRR